MTQLATKEPGRQTWALSDRHPTSFRVNNFDLIRIFAALQVLLFHAIERLQLPAPVWLTALSFFHGVPIFFVASGFMVSASYERQAGDWKRYFRNRALRIFPGLWVCVLITIAVTAWLGFRPHVTADFIWAPAQMIGLIYTPPYLHSFGSGPYNGALWTIPLELQFYIVLPAVYLVMSCLTKRSNQVLWAVFALFVLIALALDYLAPPGPAGMPEPLLNKLVRYSFLPQFHLFLFGALLQRYRVYTFKWLAGKGLYWTAGFLAFSYLPESASSHILAMLLLGVTAVSMAYTAPELGRKLLRDQDISYGVYIYHGLVINILISIGVVSSWIEFGVLLSATLGLAGISWRYVERPALKSKQKLLAAALQPALPDFL